MREFKFRAWDKSTEEMYFWEDLIVDNDTTLSDFNEMEEWVFMQWTGLLDKNGKDVYEGDIVKFRDTRDDCEFQGEVFFEKGSFIIMVKKGVFEPLIAIHFIEELEVIGNVFKNPELLEEK